MPIPKYCWRCDMVVPMLTDAEQKIVWAVMTDRSISLSERRATLCEEYTRMTGFKETNPNAVFHHVASLYGPPCETCGKPLRTPKASFCAPCGTPKNVVD